jgi:cytochrome-b5 reductase
MYQLIQGIFKNPQEKTKVTLVFGINSDRDALFRDEFSQLEKRFPGRFKVVYTASNPAEGSTFRKGYVSKELLQEVVGKDSSKVFICGPPAFEESLLGASGPFGKAQGGILSQLGYSKDQVYKF